LISASWPVANSTTPDIPDPAVFRALSNCLPISGRRFNAWLKAICSNSKMDVQLRAHSWMCPFVFV